MVTAWIIDGKLYLQDRHAQGNFLPEIDDENHWNPLYAMENDTHTIIALRRDINTCDSQDFVLTVSIVIEIIKMNTNFLLLNIKYRNFVIFETRAKIMIR